MHQLHQVSPFLGYFTGKVQCKTKPDIIPITFYIFDSIRPYIFLSYPTSIYLPIAEFNVPNKASTNTVINTITNTSETTHITLNTPLQTSPPSLRRQHINRSSSQSLGPFNHHKTIHRVLLARTLRHRRSPLFRSIAIL